MAKKKKKGPTLDELVQEELNQQWDYLLERGYKEEQIVGLFLYGSQNYGFATEVSDVDTIAIIVPDFEDFCLNTKLYNKEHIFKGKEHIVVKDIRLYRDMLLKQSINGLETLFTKYCIISPRYKELFQQYFLDNNELIAHYDEKRILNSIYGQMLTHLHDFHARAKDEDKNLYNANRLYVLFRDYAADKTFAEALVPSGLEQVTLMQMKTGDFAQLPDHAAKVKYADALQKAAEDLLNKTMVPSMRAETAAAAINEGTIAILKSFFGIGEVKPVFTKEDFYNSLTTREKQGYQVLIEKTHGKGNVNITELTKTSNISRPVYTHVTSKIQQFHLGIAKNMGAKGLYLEITHPELKKEIEDLYGIHL